MKLLVLDGNSIVNRAYYGIKLLSTKEGIFTNGIYGFLTILEKMKEETKPDAVAIAFDLRAPTFRHKQYDKYKGNRKGMPEELAMQMPILKELLGYLGYKIVSLEGYEADDILGTLAKTCEQTGVDCVIATGDRDSLQLVSDKTFVRLASTKFGQSIVTIYDKEKILEDYGVSPKQLIDIKAIQGDNSDIPVDKRFPTEHITEEMIREALASLEGERLQTPPQYSAKRIEGVRAYEMARQGEVVKMRQSLITIYSIKLLEIDMPRITVEVTCSKGTYIRSLAYEVGEALQSGGHLTALRRDSSGGHNLSNSWQLDDFLKKINEIETKS